MATWSLLVTVKCIYGGALTRPQAGKRQVIIAQDFLDLVMAQSLSSLIEIYEHGVRVLARASELSWSSWKSARIVLPRSICACTSSSSRCPWISTDTCAHGAHGLGVMVYLPGEHMDPENREDDQPMDLE